MYTAKIYEDGGGFLAIEISDRDGVQYVHRELGYPTLWQDVAALISPDGCDIDDWEGNQIADIGGDDELGREIADIDDDGDITLYVSHMGNAARKAIFGAE